MSVQTITIPIQKPHPKQRELLANRKRFNVLKCGRRFGKTELCQELIMESSLYGHYVGYWSPTYKDLYEVWQESKRNFRDALASTSETVKQMVFTNGTKVDFWSMEDPDSGRGRKYHRVIMDECEKAGKFQQAWEQTIRATLTDFKGDAYFLSTPQFGDTYFKQICNFQDEFSDWRTFIYTTYDNPYIDPQEIELARQQLHPSVFACEYMAEDVDGKTLNPFAFQFDNEYHVEPVSYAWSKQAVVSIDFNLNPFAATFSHVWEDQKGLHIHVVNEVSIENGSIEAMAKEIKKFLQNAVANCIITGDAMGNARNISQADNASHYQMLRKFLHLPESQFRVKSNPTHDQSRNDVNVMLWLAKQPDSRVEFKINPGMCKGTVSDFRNVQCDATGQIVKRNRKDLAQRADFIDTIRYLVHYFVAPKLKRHSMSLKFGNS